MNHAIKLYRLSSQSCLLSSGLSSINTRKGVGSVRLVQVKSGYGSKQLNFHSMDKNQNHKDINLNVMEESFGEGYATRSEDEGFGGIYGDKDEGNAEMKIVQDTVHHDKNQGSEVKEKEKGHHQTHVKETT